MQARLHWETGYLNAHVIDHNLLKSINVFRYPEQREGVGWSLKIIPKWISNAPGLEPLVRKSVICSLSRYGYNF